MIGEWLSTEHFTDVKNGKNNFYIVIRKLVLSPRLLTKCQRGYKNASVVFLNVSHYTN